MRREIEILGLKAIVHDEAIPENLKAQGVIAVFQCGTNPPVYLVGEKPAPTLADLAGGYCQKESKK